MVALVLLEVTPVAMARLVELGTRAAVLAAALGVALPALGYEFLTGFWVLGLMRRFLD